ncbi:MAG: hypothetical protein H3C62_16890, partial [Gemmatimonadaceae bacterium]|nr:hypothetical protein [Gemmatimonadaceae bacterium]
MTFFGSRGATRRRAACRRAWGVAAALTLASLPLDAQHPAKPSARPWMEARRPAAERAQLLLRQMTVEEKFWQLVMVPGDP